MNEVTSNKLNGKDLINIGIYSAIYFVISAALAVTGLIPIMLMLLSSMYGIICGIPFMLFLTKVKKPGMIFIMSLIMGIMMFLTGMTWVPIPVSAVTGLIAELVYRMGEYKSMKEAVLTAGVFPLWACGNYIPLFIQREAYYAGSESYSADYISSVMNMTPWWMLPLLFVMTFVAGILGGLLGKKLLKKHFQRAGVA